MQKLVIGLLPWQDNVRIQHYSPQYPQVVEAMALALGGGDDERAFKQLSFYEWLKHTDMRLLNGGARIVP